jgi:hypothetical protein
MFGEAVLTSGARLSYWACGGYQAALRGRRVGGLVHYIQYKQDILDIFSEYFLKVPQIYSNMLEYTRIFPCWMGRCPNNHDLVGSLESMDGREEPIDFPTTPKPGHYW